MADEATEFVEGLVWRLLAAQADRKKIVQILEAALADFGQGYAYGELFGRILSELLAVTDGLIADHPRARDLRMIYAAQAEIAELTGEESGP